MAAWIKWTWLLLCVLFAGGCAQALISGRLEKDGSVKVRVPKAASIGEMTNAVLDTAAEAGLLTSTTCTIYWGNLGQGPRGAQPLALTIGSDTVIDGWLLCMSLLPDPFDIDPRVNQIRLLSWGKGELIAGHPDGHSVVVKDPGDLTAGQPDGYPVAFAIFDVEGASLEAPISQLAPTLKALPEGFVFIEWMIEHTNQR